MIEKFTDAIFTDVSSPITLLFILIVSIYFIARFLINNWSNIKSYFEHCYQSRKKKEELYETVESLEKAKDDIVAETKLMSKNQKSFYDKQMQYRQVSQELRNRLEEKTNKAITTSEEANKRSEETLSQIKELKLLIEEIKNKQEEIDADRKAQKVNELRKDLIDAYHHFGNKDSNPTMTWNEMEAHAFWSIYNDYVRYGGNDFAHKVIEPAMRKLIVVPITEDTN